ncbi:hypothetical protein LBMAG53_33840 [Planctomycetota bacterium]|nr:hypothetical protein LBMAG53_33840 [Planctomycetota bacterium]
MWLRPLLCLALACAATPVASTSGVVVEEWLQAPPLPWLAEPPPPWMDRFPARLQATSLNKPPSPPVFVASVRQPAVRSASAQPILTERWRGRWVTVRATGYSPHDRIDSGYHATKGSWRWITADGRTDVRTQPYGLAVPRRDGNPWLRYGTRVFIPAGQGYLDQTLTRADQRVFTVDDTGAAISRRTQGSGTTFVDLRFATEHAARQFGGDRGWRSIRLFIIDEVD